MSDATPPPPAAQPNTSGGAGFPPPVSSDGYQPGAARQPYPAQPDPSGPYGPQASATAAYGTSPSAGSPSSNGLGIAALITGGVALLLALVPIVNFLAILVALTGLILAIVALAKKIPARAIAIAAVIVSAVALVLAIALAVIYTTQIVASLNEADDQPGIPSPSLEPEDPTFGDDLDQDGLNDGPADGDLGSRSNPAPIGDTAEFADFEGAPEWEVIPGEPVLDATAQVAQDSSNETAPSGSRFVLLPVDIRYVGADTGFGYDISVAFVSEDGNTYDAGDVYATVPPELTDINELYPGADAAGNVVIAVPSDEIESGTWAVSTLNSEPYFFTAQ